jgi:anaerobic magnesium-protoporphyrin IX monomethyl ester cyclase
MFQVALVGPELEENLSLRYLASSLTAAGFDCEIVPFNSSNDLAGVLAALLEAGQDSPFRFS